MKSQDRYIKDSLMDRKNAEKIGEKELFDKKSQNELHLLQFCVI
jgi:hypothetical protein